MRTRSEGIWITRLLRKIKIPRRPDGRRGIASIGQASEPALPPVLLRRVVVLRRCRVLNRVLHRRRLRVGALDGVARLGAPTCKRPSCARLSCLSPCCTRPAWWAAWASGPAGGRRASASAWAWGAAPAWGGASAGSCHYRGRPCLAYRPYPGRRPCRPNHPCSAEGSSCRRRPSEESWSAARRRSLGPAARGRGLCAAARGRGLGPAARRGGLGAATRRRGLGPATARRRSLETATRGDDGVGGRGGRGAGGQGEAQHAHREASGGKNGRRCLLHISPLIMDISHRRSGPGRRRIQRRILAGPPYRYGTNSNGTIEHLCGRRIVLESEARCWINLGITP